VGESISHLVRKPVAGQPHTRFDERDLETEPSGHRARSRLYSEPRDVTSPKGSATSRATARAEPRPTLRLALLASSAPAIPGQRLRTTTSAVDIGQGNADRRLRTVRLDQRPAR